MSSMSIDQAFEWARQQHLAGQLAAAEKVYRQILIQHPNHAPSLQFLGVLAVQLGQSEQGIRLLRRSLAISPNVPDYRYNLGLALQASGSAEEALTEFRAALRLSPGMASAGNSLTTLLNARGRHEEAVEAFQAALQARPNDGAIYNNLGITETARGHFAAAERALERALELLPHSGEAYANLGGLLRDSGRIDEAIAAYRQALERTPTLQTLWSDLLMTLHYHPTLAAQEIEREHRIWAEKVAAPLTALAAAPQNDRSPDRRLRIAYISADFREHPIAYFMAPILRAHDRNQFEVFCYGDLRRPDQVTERLRASVENWREIQASEDDARIAQRIRADQIDVLIDLGSHTAGNRLLTFAHRAAPVQISYLGYCAPTGLPAMDWRVTDAIIDPEQGAASGAEKLLRLDRAFCAYCPPSPAPDVTSLPAAAAGHVAFGALCTLAKVTEPVIALWAKVLLAVTGSKLLIRARGLDEETGARFCATFAQFGIAPERLLLLNHAALPEYLATFGRVDIELNPFPYSAHTTTCHALWMGVPVVTLTGQGPLSRVSASVLTAVGLSELIAATDAEYVKIAAALATDMSRLAELRASLRERLQSSPLLDGEDMTRTLEAAYRKAWRTWVGAASHPA